MKYIISAGGTGGHIYPALSIIDKIKEQIDCDVLKIKSVTPYSTDYNSVINDEQNSERSNFLS